MYLPRLLKNLIYLSVFVYFLYSVYATSSAIYSSSKKTEEIIHKKEVLGAKKQELESKLQVINTDDFVEKEARTKLNMKKENEQIFVVNTGINNVSREESSEASKSKKSVFSRWMEVIF